MDWSDTAAVAEAIDIPFEEWAHACHAISCQIVRHIEPTARVARGICDGVGSQHSWVVLGPDCYDPEAPIVDATLWSYDPQVEGIWTGSIEDGRHRPFGLGPHIMELGCPRSGGGPEIELTPRRPLSEEAEWWLGMFRSQLAGAPLDWEFWAGLSNMSVVGWPAGEFIEAMHWTRDLSVVVPIDKLGMLTQINPGRAYLAGPEVV